MQDHNVLCGPKGNPEESGRDHENVWAPRKVSSQVPRYPDLSQRICSESQYERQLKAWGIRKNCTRDEWRLVTRAVEERRRQGKDSAVLIRGIKQPSERVSRELARSGYSRQAGVTVHQHRYRISTDSSKASNTAFLVIYKYSPRQRRLRIAILLPVIPRYITHQ